MKANTDVTKPSVRTTCGASGRQRKGKERKISAVNGRGMRGGVQGGDIWLDRVWDAQGGEFLGQQEHRKEYGRRGRHRTGETNEPSDSRKAVQWVLD